VWRGGAAAARYGKKAAGDIMGHLKAVADASLDRTGSGATRPIDEIKKRLDSFAAGANIDTKGQAKMFAPPSADDLFEKSFGKIDPDQRFSAVAEQRSLLGDPAQGKLFNEAELNAIPRQKQKASATFGPVRRVSHATGRGRNNARSVLPPGGDDALGLHGGHPRSTVFVATGRIRRGPTHLRDAGEAAALVKDIRRSTQEKFFTIAVDEDGKILNLHKYSKGKKDTAPVNAIEAAGFAAKKRRCPPTTATLSMPV